MTDEEIRREKLRDYVEQERRERAADREWLLRHPEPDETEDEE